MARVLITSGGTREPIDAVRFITNGSTGKTGAVLADFFASLGFDVTLLHGQGAQLPQSEAALRSLQSFGSFSDLNLKLEAELGRNEYLAVIHAAAVSDFYVADGNEGGKLTSDGDQILRLKPHFKIIERLRSYSRGHPQIVAFKLTVGATRREADQAVARLAQGGQIDWIVQNDAQQIQGLAKREGHEFNVYSGRVAPDLHPPRRVVGPEALGVALVECLKKEVL